MDGYVGEGALNPQSAQDSAGSNPSLKAILWKQGYPRMQLLFSNSDLSSRSRENFWLH